MASPINSGTLRRLAGESLREVGILVLVFGPLDAILKNEKAATPFAIVTAALGLMFTVVGMIIETNAHNRTP